MRGTSLDSRTCLTAGLHFGDGLHHLAKMWSHFLIARSLICPSSEAQNCAAMGRILGLSEKTRLRSTRCGTKAGCCKGDFATRKCPNWRPVAAASSPQRRIFQSTKRTSLSAPAAHEGLGVSNGQIFSTKLLISNRIHSRFRSREIIRRRASDEFRFSRPPVLVQKWGWKAWMWADDR